MTTLSRIEKLAKAILTAKTIKTAIKHQNKLNQLSAADRVACLKLVQTHGNPAMVGHNAIYPNSYLVGGTFRG